MICHTPVFLSLGISAVPALSLSDSCRLAGKFRLTLPLLYFLLAATVLNPWAAAHETLAFAILFGLLASLVRHKLALFSKERPP